VDTGSDPTVGAERGEALKLAVLLLLEKLSPTERAVYVLREGFDYSYNQIASITLAWVETNGQAAVLVSREDLPVALTTIDACEQGIDQIVWILRPSKLAAISKLGQGMTDRDAARPAAA
jgi:Sigma-70, region 4